MEAVTVGKSGSYSGRRERTHARTHACTHARTHARTHACTHVTAARPYKERAVDMIYTAERHQGARGAGGRDRLVAVFAASTACGRV